MILHQPVVNFDILGRFILIRRFLRELDWEEGAAMLLLHCGPLINSVGALQLRKSFKNGRVRLVQISPFSSLVEQHIVQAGARYIS